MKSVRVREQPPDNPRNGQSVLNHWRSMTTRHHIHRSSLPVEDFNSLHSPFRGRWWMKMKVGMLMGIGVLSLAFYYYIKWGHLVNHFSLLHELTSWFIFIILTYFPSAKIERPDEKLHFYKGWWKFTWPKKGYTF